MKKRFSTRSLCLSAIVAGLYAALTLGFQAISYGAVQFRVSECMTLLPVLFPEAVPGLAAGCLISNLFSPMGVNAYDVVFGTLATLVSALLSRRFRKRLWLAALMPVVVNAAVIGMVMTYGYGVDLLWTNMLTVGAGEAAVCYALGIPLTRLLKGKLRKLI